VIETTNAVFAFAGGGQFSPDHQIRRDAMLFLKILIDIPAQ
jgi:hypothetical protein